jgi:hypothetical protein
MGARSAAVRIVHGSGDFHATVWPLRLVEHAVTTTTADNVSAPILNRMDILSVRGDETAVECSNRPRT